MAVPETVLLGFGSSGNMNDSSIFDKFNHKMASMSSVVSNTFLPTPTASIVNLDSKSDTASVMLPLCRFCHSSDSSESGDMMISPCRCAGTLQFIHHTCLMKWLEVLSRKSRKSPKCELCHYPYKKHKKFRLNHWQFPHVSGQDKFLHSIFAVNILIMILSAGAAVMCFLTDNGQTTAQLRRSGIDVTTREAVTLSCGILFFVSFFILLSVQLKARQTIYMILKKFIMRNMEWKIYDYDKSKDEIKTPVFV